VTGCQCRFRRTWPGLVVADGADGADDILERRTILITLARFDYPTLRAQAVEHARVHRPTIILIEDTGVGTALVSELRNQGFSVVGVKVEHNKEIRMAIQCGKFESGLVVFPRRASWLDDLEAELFAFPGSPHDDQVDSISQALAYQIKRSLWTDKSLEGLANFTNAMAFDSNFGRMTGRPW
jgi:predicted phage terminase large subunit-like protein